MSIKTNLEDAIDCTLRRTRLGRGYEPIARQTKIMNEY